MKPFSPLAGVTQRTLPNGLDVILRPDRRWPVVSVHAWVKVGSVDEVPARAGLAHILEHMVFKGTRRYSGDAVSRRVEQAGGHMNAETSREFTHYYIDIPSDGAAEAVRILAELTCHATLDGEEWRRECPVILEEMKRRADDPDVRLWDVFQEVMFDHEPLQRAVIGTEASVRAATIEDIRRFYRGHYTAGNTVVAIAGDFSEPALLRLVQREFAEMPAGERREMRRRWPDARSRATERTVRQKIRQAYGALGVLTPPADHEDQEALDLLADILTYGRNARLSRILREEKRLVWSVSASHMTHEGPGLFAIFLVCDPAKRDAATRACRRILQDFIGHPPTREEVERAKRAVQVAWWQGWETAHHQAAALGHHAMDRQLPRFERALPKLLGLTRAQLHRVTRRYLSQPWRMAWVQP